MNLECLNDIITDRLAIHIDVTDINSWNLNTGFTSISLTKWSGAKSDNINLYDFGLNAYDNGRVDDMLSGLTLTPTDLLLQLERVGYNNATGGTFYDLYPMSGVTTGSTVGNYFELSGGYLQGFFKLQGENYEVFPARYGEGITIETIVRLDLDSSGILFYMGARAEDKYNTFFSGETKQIETEIREQVGTGVVGQTNTIVRTVTSFSGVTTSKDNNLHAFLDEQQLQDSFGQFEDQYETVPVEQPKDATFNNVIAFGISDDRRLIMQKIDGNGLIDLKVSPNQMINTGWTVINMTFTPDEIITDAEELKCAERRTGTLDFYVNGRRFWQLNDFEEFYFVDIKNNPEKTYGNSYNMSWGGGSFGLKHSYHWDLITYPLYTGQTQQYIDDNFMVRDNPLVDDVCNVNPPIITGTSGNSIVLIENSDAFQMQDPCDPMSGTSITVMEVAYSGVTGQSLNEYFIEFSTPIELLSNRDYDFSAEIYDSGLFKSFYNGEQVVNSISLVVYGTTDISVVNDVVYKRPVTLADLQVDTPFPTFEGEFEYLDEATGLLIDAQTGLPVVNDNNITIIQQNNGASFVTGEDIWNTIKLKVESKENSGRQTFFAGILIKSTAPINEDGQLFIRDFVYKGSDALSQDSTKRNLLVEQNFNESFNGGVQKLRVYDIAFTSAMALHNARIESINNPAYGLTVRRGGRIITR